MKFFLCFIFLLSSKRTLYPLKHYHNRRRHPNAKKEEGKEEDKEKGKEEVYQKEDKEEDKKEEKKIDSPTFLFFYIFLF
jgi:hypothetical protein